MNDLFRREVLDRQAQRLYGDVVLVPPIGHLVILALLIIMMMILIAFLTFGEYSRKERVPGFLTPDKGVIHIATRETGLVKTVHVKVGSLVSKGDPLFSIQTDTVSSYGNDTAKVILEQLNLEKRELLLRRDLIPMEYRLRRDRLFGQMKALKSEAEKITQRISIQIETVQNERVVLNKFQSLIANNAASELEVSNQKNRLLVASQALISLELEKQRYEDQVLDINAQIKLMPVAERRELSEIDGFLTALEQRIATTQIKESVLIEAPVSGQVASLISKEGQMLPTQHIMATILPVGSTLEAKLFVPSRAAGFVEKGQSVRILYDAFPYQKYGYYEGTITNISKTVVDPSSLDIPSGHQDPSFLVTVSLNQHKIKANKTFYELQSGMTLAADIILEDRKIWEWAFEPIIGMAKS